jgi:hypothetical protein
MVGVPDSCVSIARYLADTTVGPNGPDWDRVFRLAEANEIAPYVYKGLTELQGEAIPFRVMAQFEQEYETSRRRNRVLREEFLFVLKRLRRKGIEPIPYKGPLSFPWPDSDIEMRGFKDVDFLVAVKDLEGIQDVLGSLGYRPEKPWESFLQPGFEQLDKDYPFVRETAWTTGSAVPGSSNDMRKFGWMILEPHWSLAHPRLNVDLPVQELRSRTRTAHYNDEEINLLSFEDAALVACIVGSKSEWRSLKFVADLAVVIESSPGLDWDLCLERADRARSRRMFLLGSLLAKQIAGSSVPDRVERAALEDESVARIARKTLREVGNESAETRVDPRRFSLRKDRWRYVVDTLTAPSGLERRLLPLPPRFRFAYRFVVPVVRYLALPVVRWARQLSGRGVDRERNYSAL